MHHAFLLLLITSWFLLVCYSWLHPAFLLAYCSSPVRILCSCSPAADCRACCSCLHPAFPIAFCVPGRLLRSCSPAAPDCILHPASCVPVAPDCILRSCCSRLHHPARLPAAPGCILRSYPPAAPGCVLRSCSPAAECIRRACSPAVANDILRSCSRAAPDDILVPTRLLLASCVPARLFWLHCALLLLACCSCLHPACLLACCFGCVLRSRLPAVPDGIRLCCGSARCCCPR